MFRAHPGAASARYDEESRRLRSNPHQGAIFGAHPGENRPEIDAENEPRQPGF
jgi:hypothetical protein